ncbi:GIY-YIG nuclease family protein [Patescibacteria group bacterium]|nr:GIY-YIG nuclease family protein [Patescibacteria group bacterium]MBU0964054.1 GIY-YIG nuclease family protein [Patescibacteria group bacterium]
MYYIYLLKSLKKKWFYIGSTNKLNLRLKQHNAGKVRSTKAYTPFILIYLEAYNNKVLARKREIELKKSSQQKEILYKRLDITKYE